MKWLAAIIVILLTILKIASSGNYKFWKLVRRYPAPAYKFFKENDCWFIIHPGETKKKPKDGKWSGPYFINIPGVGRLKIYGRDSDYEKKQQEFINFFL